MSVLDLDDPADPRLDAFRDLTVADRRPDRPGGRGAVIAEGVVVVRRLLASAYPVEAVLGVPARLADLAPDFAAAGQRLAGVPVYRTPAAVMDAVVGFHLNRGVLAVAGRPEPAPTAADLVGVPRLLVCEGVNDHENLGALFRNAAALGVGGVLLGPRCADPLYRRSVRVSMGHVLRVPFAPLRPWPGRLADLQAAGYTVLALTPTGELTLREIGTPTRAALLVGAEGPGLTPEALAAADHRVRIPMASGVDSLNVATAAAVALAHLAPSPDAP